MHLLSRNLVFCVVVFAADETNAFTRTCCRSPCRTNHPWWTSTTHLASFQANAHSCTDEEVLEDLLENGRGDSLKKAALYIRRNPHLRLTNQRVWSSIFRAIEERTMEADELCVNKRAAAAADVVEAASGRSHLLAAARNDMNEMYQALRDTQHLSVFGAIDTRNLASSDDNDTQQQQQQHTVSPALFQQVTGLNSTAIKTPKPKNTLVQTSIALGALDGITSFAFNVDMKLVLIVTLLAAVMDRTVLNGAAYEALGKLIKPSTHERVLKHEAGHLLCAYLLGCPVEGCVLNAWDALQDVRFSNGRQQVTTAGTSFFDPVLAKEITEPTKVVSPESLDRYCIIVMGGIAAEAMCFGHAKGGAADEAALCGLMRKVNPVVNQESLLNQSQWAAMQAILILRQYQPCYDALVNALQTSGSHLGDWIYAIEDAARQHKLGPLQMFPEEAKLLETAQREMIKNVTEESLFYSPK